ncbi:LysR substrate-binding domain-containing protein [Abyssibius alkaniclasticus]|uniref:LysR substrate-binding domain-containing protein n=1 Tax=Abyssibius alkaniclasticus TaxID=2881234 RepID=UPI0023639E97|nr:LysR substrate-binding domain-containing protein [Abyssibius alkaniclasticus]UPH70453.1 LysR substrate-binding domain-containing protein [Abyssibius alkaniclasticus]
MRHAQLRAFHAVALHGGFSRAGEVLHVTQPAISDQVRRLEQEYDILLFHRDKKQVRLTARGQALLEITNRLFAAEGQALEFLSESRGAMQGRLRIMVDSAHHVLGLLARFRQDNPLVAIEINTGNTAQVVAALQSYKADVGILGDAPDSPGLATRNLGASPIVAFAARRMNLPAECGMTLAELAEYPLILREKGSKTRQKLDEAAARLGLTLVPAVEAEGREAVREIVAAGAGIGFVSQAEFGLDQRLQIIPILGQTLLMDEALVCLRDRAQTRLISAFMGLAE